MKRLALFLDGTWNEPGDNTNVWRLKVLVDPDPEGAPAQLTYYHVGVGSRWYNRLRGGAFARGLSRNIREAYQWLIEHYDEGDEVFIFGFSRGAYTARSLAGMIAKCGLLRPGAPMTVLEIFERYKERDGVRPLYKLEYLQRKGATDLGFQDRWLLEHSVRIPIRFIGVWDTVGTLGIPFGRIPGISRKTLYFHNTRLSKIYERCYQALAVDEHRKPYRPAIWTKYTPKDEPGEEDDEGYESPDPVVEQRWFIGAHSNVGGGYRNDPLAQLPLAWLQQMAQDAGLRFRRQVRVHDDDHLAPVVDSYGRFLKGLYKFIKFGRRFYRQIGRPDVDLGNAVVSTVNETIDDSVVQRWKAGDDYRPPNLDEYAQRKGVDLSAT